MTYTSRILAAICLGCASVSAVAATWDFSTLTDSDKANLNADTGAWKYDSGNNRWANQTVLDNVPVSANGAVLEMTAGLRISATGTDNIRIDDKKKSVTLNKTTGSITIPGLHAGDIVTVNAQSSSSSTARSLKGTNLGPTAGFAASTDRLDNVAAVLEDGDVTLSASGGFYVYSISVTSAGGGTGPDNPDEPQADHSMRFDPTANQMLLTMDDHSVKYYTTSALGGVDIDSAEGAVTVSALSGEWTDSFKRNVAAINFSKKPATGSEGTITNRGVNITEAKGWLEALYAKWTPEAGTTYNIYVKGTGSYEKVDAELVRNYGSYGRVDVPGLPAGYYTLKVVPVKGGVEDDAQASTVENVAVRAYKREGFAFHNFSGVGAYDDNGRLKPGARVLYVSAKNAKTVTLDMKTAASKTTTATGLQTILQLYEKGYEDRPLAVRILGTIRAEDMDYFGSSEEGLQIKGKNKTPINLTMEGIGDDAAVYGFGFNVRSISSLEMRNFGVLWFMDDGISINTDNSHVWVHHMDLFYGQPGSAADQVKGDGTIDIKDDSQYITVAYNHLWDSGKASLCGMKSETGPNYIDYNHNWFDHSDSRHPRVRTMTVHVWNNYYDGVSKYGSGATMGASIFCESNFYRCSKNPMLISGQGTDAKGSGTFSGETGGIVKSYGNLYAEKGSSSGYTPITSAVSATGFDCYEVADRNAQIPATVKSVSGSHTYHNFDTDPSLMYAYTPSAAADVPAIVTGFYGAGRLGGGNFRWTFNNAKDDADYSVNVPLQNALKAYAPAQFTSF